MANTIGFGQAAVNNTIDYGQGAIDNTINWGKSQTLSPSGETNITGTGGTPPFSNVNSFSFNGIDEFFLGTSTYSELDGQNKATISLWAKFDNLNSFRILTSLTRNSNVNDFVFMLCNVGNVLRFFTSSTTQYTYSNAVLTANTWLHIMVNIDKTQGASATRCKIFINGQDETSATVSQDGTALQTSNSSLYIGENQNGKYSPMLGKIDEFAIWSGTDLRNDVATIYNNGTPTDLNNNGLTAPTTWQRMGDNATWNGATWTMTDVNGSYTNRSIFMVEANRSTDVPTASSFTNTKSILLDGVDDFVSIPTITLATDFSVSMWVKATTGGSVRDQVFGGASGFFLFGTTVLSGGLLSNKMCYVNGGSYVALTPAIIRDGNWHNIVITYNSSATNLVAYTDGVETYNATYNAGTNNVIDRISEDTYGNYWKGNLDELAVWTSELTSSDVTSIYNSGVPNDISSLSPLSWWRCGDGDTSPTLTDNGSGGNDGTMVFFNTFSTDVPT